MMVSYTEHLPVHQRPIIVVKGEKALPTATFMHERKGMLFSQWCSGRPMHVPSWVTNPEISPF